VSKRLVPPALWELANDVRTCVERALDGNPFDPETEARQYRRWEAAQEVSNGIASCIHAYAGIHYRELNHAAAEGFDYV